MPVIITQFFYLLLSCLIQKIYTKPLTENDNNNENTDTRDHQDGNATLKIFMVVVVLFIIGSILYYTKSLWWGSIKRSCCGSSSSKSVKEQDPDMDITEQHYDNIVFDSINFSEVAGNSNLSIDITNIMDKYMDNSREESSILEINSLSQANIPKPDSKTMTSLNPTQPSPSIENYDDFEDELNHLKSQEITETKIPEGDTSYIENSPSFLHGESVSKKILVGINNVEITSSIESQSLDSDDYIKEKASLKSKKSDGEKGQEVQGEDSSEPSVDNSVINMNDEKTLINKNLKPLSLDDEEASRSSSEEEANPSEEEEKEEEQKEVSEGDQSSDSSYHSSIDNIQIIVSPPNTAAPAPVNIDEDKKKEEEESLTSFIPQNTQDTLSSSNSPSQELEVPEEHVLDMNSSSEESISHVGAKIDPISTNDDSMSSLDLGENHTTNEDIQLKDEVEEEIIEVVTDQANVDSLEPGVTAPANNSFAIINELKPELDQGVSISAIEENLTGGSSEVVVKVDETITPTEPMDTPEEIPSTEIVAPTTPEPSSSVEVKDEPIVVVETPNTSEAVKVETIVQGSTAEPTVESPKEKEPSTKPSIDAVIESSDPPVVESMIEEVKEPSTEPEKKVDVPEELAASEPPVAVETAEQKAKIEEKLQEIQQSLESSISEEKPPIPENSKTVAGDEIKNLPPLKLNKRTSSLNLHIKKRKESISAKPGHSSSKKNRASHKKIQQSIDEEIQSLSNEMTNDTIKEKFNDYVERRSSIQSDASSHSFNSKRASALSAYILQNEGEVDLSEATLPSKSNLATSSKVSSSLNIDTSVSPDASIFTKEDHTPDKQSPLASSSSFIASNPLHGPRRSPTPSGNSRLYGPSPSPSPSPSVVSSSDSLRDQCISPTPSEDSTVSTSSSFSYSIGKVSRNKQFEVVYDHKPQLPDEIPLRKGDQVQIKQVFEDGWAYGIVKNKRMDGIFPIQCLGEEIEPSRNGRMVPRLVRVYQARLEDEEQERQEEEEFKKKISDQARKNILLKLALSHPK